MIRSQIVLDSFWITHKIGFRTFNSDIWYILIVFHALQFNQMRNYVELMVRWLLFFVSVIVWWMLGGSSVAILFPHNQFLRLTFLVLFSEKNILEFIGWFSLKKFTSSCWSLLRFNESYRCCYWPKHSRLQHNKLFALNALF